MMESKIIAKIESYSHKDGLLLLSIDNMGARVVTKDLVNNCNKDYGGYIKLKMSKPYRDRTTGAGSQNSKFYALVRDICQDTGNDIEDVKEYLKERAVRRGYPTRMNPFTKKFKPCSTTEVNTVEMSFLIDEALQLCSELGIVVE